MSKSRAQKVLSNDNFQRNGPGNLTPSSPAIFTSEIINVVFKVVSSISTLEFSCVIAVMVHLKLTGGTLSFQVGEGMV